MVLITLATLWAGIGSAVLSGTSSQIAERFHVGSVVAELANSMFVSNAHPQLCSFPCIVSTAGLISHSCTSG